jgi:hypothetical protein
MKTRSFAFAALLALSLPILALSAEKDKKSKMPPERTPGRIQQIHLVMNNLDEGGVKQAEDDVNSWLKEQGDKIDVIEVKHTQATHQVNTTGNVSPQRQMGTIVIRISYWVHANPGGS